MPRLTHEHSPNYEFTVQKKKFDLKAYALRCYLQPLHLWNLEQAPLFPTLPSPFVDTEGKRSTGWLRRERQSWPPARLTIQARLFFWRLTRHPNDSLKDWEGDRATASPSSHKSKPPSTASSPRHLYLKKEKNKTKQQQTAGEGGQHGTAVARGSA